MVEMSSQRTVGSRIRAWPALAFLALGLAACAGPLPDAAQPVSTASRPTLPLDSPTLYPAEVPSFVQVGLASWYGPHFARKLTASGERFDMNQLTAAHRSLPLATMVRVTNLANGRHVLLRINDRGPYAGARIIDVSREAAEMLGMKQDGVAQVRLEVFDVDQVKTLAASTRSFRTE
jgi:rare lipoprotein A